MSRTHLDKNNPTITASTATTIGTDENSCHESPIPTQLKSASTEEEVAITTSSSSSLSSIAAYNSSSAATNTNTKSSSAATTVVRTESPSLVAARKKWQ